MRPIALYLVTALIFLAVDAVMLGLWMAPLFRSHIGDLMAQPMRLGPAAVFYAGYVAAILYLASLPALRARAPFRAILPGAVLGAAAYGTFEFTSYAILSDWHISMVITDTIWGAVLTGLSAWAGVAAITRRWR